MRLILLVFILLILDSAAKAQDTLIYKDGQRKVVKIEEVNTEQIKFRKSDNLSGPIYIVSSKEIKYIKYPNGTQDVFVDESKEDDFVKPKDHVFKNNVNRDSLIYRTTNLLSANFMDLMVLSPSLSYEWIQDKGNFSVWVPVAVGINPYGRLSNNYSYIGGFLTAKKNYTVGLGLKYYFNGQGKSSFFIAPLFEYGSVVYAKMISSYSNGYYMYTFQKSQAPLYIGSLNVGNLYSFENGFILILHGGVGVRSQKTKLQPMNYSNGNYSYEYQYLVFPTVKLGLSIGYRF